MSTYRPINCELHDVMESCATQRRPVNLHTRAPSGAVRSLQVVVTDVFSLDGAEYLCTLAGDRIRLDEVVRIDGYSLSSANQVVRHMPK